MKYNKLVRDNIPSILKAKGEKYKTHKAGKLEYWAKLKEKLAEEVAEFTASESAEELADILEVIDAITKFKKVDKRTLATIKRKKLRERGGFEKKIILEES